MFGRQYKVLAEYARARGITSTLDGRITRRELVAVKDSKG